MVIASILLALYCLAESEMPAFEPQHVEYNVISGRISVVGDDGTYLPAYWSHPDIGGRFPAVVILHDWWGSRTLSGIWRTGSPA